MCLQRRHPAPVRACAHSPAAHLDQPSVDPERVEVDQTDRADVPDDAGGPAVVVPYSRRLPLAAPGLLPHREQVGHSRSEVRRRPAEDLGLPRGDLGPDRLLGAMERLGQLLAVDEDAASNTPDRRSVIVATAARRVPD
jgi:hypothetical protein